MCFFDAVDECGVLDYALVFLGVYEAVGYECAFAVGACDHARAGIRFRGGGLGAYGGALFGDRGSLFVVLLALHGILGEFMGGTMIVDVRINMRNVLESLCLPWLCGAVR